MLADGQAADYAAVKQLPDHGATLTEVALDAVNLETVIGDRQSVRLDIQARTGNAVRIIGLTQAQGELNPAGTLTRAEAASMLYHLLLNNNFIE